jgi:hypothetical protein
MVRRFRHKFGAISGPEKFIRFGPLTGEKRPDRSPAMKGMARRFSRTLRRVVHRLGPYNRVYGRVFCRQILRVHGKGEDRLEAIGTA